MMKSVRVGVAALAFAGLVAQPIAASAGEGWWCHPASTGTNVAPGVFWAIGFFLCAGMTTGKQDVDAKKHHTVVTGNDRFGAFLACAFPPIGLYKLDHHA
jgi:hypothetical protein